MTFAFAGAPFLLTSLVAGALAAIVFYHGPGRAANRCLSCLLLGTSATTLGYALAAFAEAERLAFLSNRWNDVAELYWYLMILPAIPLALSWPTPRLWAPRAVASLWPWATLAVLSACVVAIDHVQGILGPEDDVFGLRGAWTALGRLMMCGLIGAALLLAYEARNEPDAGLRDGRILMAMGLGLHGVYIGARDAAYLEWRISNAASLDPLLWIAVAATPIISTLALALGILVWRSPASHVQRTARWLLAGAATAGVADAAMLYGQRNWGLPFEYEARLFLFAFWFLVPIALLAYVVLRGQIAGLDVKIRFAVSKSTVAAAFVAAFFLASEGAQILFGQGNEWVGLLGASALVFALAPLQRAAERLAERAVPLAAVATAPGVARGEASYRKAVRLALRDRRLTRQEEGHLHELARDLGLDGARAHAIITEVEAETESGAG